MRVQSQTTNDRLQHQSPSVAGDPRSGSERLAKTSACDEKRHRALKV